MKSYFSGMFMIIFLVSTGAFAATAAIQGWRNAPATNSKHILQGKWAEEFEDSFNKNLVTYNPSLAGWGTLNYLLFKEGNDGVIIGQNDWLFTKEISFKILRFPDHGFKIFNLIIKIRDIGMNIITNAFRHNLCPFRGPVRIRL